MNISRNQYKKLALLIFKYCPIITAFAMLIHSVLVIVCNVHIGYAETFCGVSAVSLLFAYLLSKGLGFCKIHRMFIDYTFKIFLCMLIHQWFGLSALLICILSGLIILGIGLFIYFFIHFKEFRCNYVK